VQAQGVWAFDIYGLGQPWILLAMNSGVRKAMRECLGKGRATEQTQQNTMQLVSNISGKEFSAFL
jgi:hypothetical protein